MKIIGKIASRTDINVNNSLRRPKHSMTEVVERKDDDLMVCHKITSVYVYGTVFHCSVSAHFVQCHVCLKENGCSECYKPSLYISLI
jgi:hypothetical protein